LNVERTHHALHFTHYFVMRLSYRDILNFTIPLSLTAVMMGVSAPVINAGIALTREPALGVAAFAVAFNLSILIHSSIFISDQLGAALIRDERSYRLVKRFCIILGSLLSIFEFVFALSPLGPWAIRELIGVDDDRTAESALSAVRLMATFPLMIGIRAVYQGVLIRNRRTRLIALATYGRLLFLVGATFLIARTWPETDGALLGAVSMGIAIFIEMTIVAVAGLRYVPRLKQATSQGGVEGYGHIFRFSLPLAITSMLWTMTGSIIISIISRSSAANTKESIVVFSIVYGLTWLLTSPTLMLQQTAISLIEDAQSLALVRRFAAIAGALMSLLVMIVAAPGVRTLVLGRIYGLNARLIAVATPLLMIVVLLPLFVSLRAFMQGLLINLGWTTSVGAAAILRVCSMFAIAYLFLLLLRGPQQQGALLGIFIMVTSLAAENFVLYLRTKQAVRHNSVLLHAGVREVLLAKN